VPLEPGSRGDAHAAGTAPETITAAQERRLVDAVLHKDRKAAAELVAAHADTIYSYVRHRMAPRVERVEDIVHDVFLAALSNLAAFRSESSLRAWLLGIARHKIEDYYRHLLREPTPLDGAGDAVEPPTDRPPIEEQIDRQRAAERTQRILSRLPEHYGVVLLWRYWENRSIREMADTTGKTEKAIERLLARAKARFRELWEEMGR
jgi:RNA polymerase sigma factor (sigma-70 family)